MLVSQPGIICNRALPENVIDKNYLKTYELNPNSNIFKIIHNGAKEDYQKNSKKIIDLNPLQMDIELVQLEQIKQENSKVDIENIF